MGGSLGCVSEAPLDYPELKFALGADGKLGFQEAGRFPGFCALASLWICGNLPQEQWAPLPTSEPMSVSSLPLPFPIATSSLLEMDK